MLVDLKYLAQCTAYSYCQIQFVYTKLTPEDDTVVTVHNRLKSPGMWRCVVGYLSTLRKINFSSCSESSSASIMICPLIYRNVGNHSPPTTQRYIINTRILSNTCGKNLQILCHNILRNISVTVWNC